MMAYYEFSNPKNIFGAPQPGVPAQIIQIALLNFFDSARAGPVVPK